MLAGGRKRNTQYADCAKVIEKETQTEVKGIAGHIFTVTKMKEDQQFIRCLRFTEHNRYVATGSVGYSNRLHSGINEAVKNHKGRFLFRTLTTKTSLQEKVKYLISK